MPPLPLNQRLLEYQDVLHVEEDVDISSVDVLTFDDPQPLTDVALHHPLDPGQVAGKEDLAVDVHHECFPVFDQLLHVRRPLHVDGLHEVPGSLSCTKELMAN